MHRKAWRFIIHFAILIILTKGELPGDSPKREGVDRSRGTSSIYLQGNYCGTNQCSQGQSQELSEEVLFKNGHKKPFGSHRPPDGRVEELPFMISSEDFYMKYVIKHKPVIFKNVVKHWPAFSKWTDEYLNTTWGNITFKMETKDDDKKNIPKDQTMSEYLTHYKGKRYLVDEVHPEMQKDIILPLALRCEEISNYFFVSFLFMSNGGTSSKIHLDTDENLLSVIRGHKETILVHPRYSADLYTDDADLLGVSDIDPLAVDMIKYPRVKNVRYLLASMDSGDALYIPQMWWHQVVSRREKQQAVAMWWKSKPYVNKQEGSSFPLKNSKQRNEKPSFSYAQALSDYEDWVQDVAPSVPRIACNSQQRYMNEYRFETSKDPDSATLGDGGDIEEIMLKTDSFADIVALRNRQKEQMKTNEEIDLRELPCDFDRLNPKNPCSVKACVNFDEENMECLRYVLDYCNEFADRGCVIHLPHLLNKKTRKEWRDLHEMDTLYGRGDKEEL
ncbi:bifunctional arginine demethylase and lysyl-hydroxylase JMJD6 [Nematostella vectensis]|uniref:bifunctional arginine demethylase and lysyl-hydroxylase JMJD6 n=1 Tax=Nematostella vectensis TaxID=45351 RepID=UPI0020771580|nr:bifunctional arginine demethylase and lysyl-hydroxylase JMJD6 [Nematostella vectensis]XP_048584049.1 bifunctional arginine demethylase and lysyl-hydroxylase JMJD6 [Nematostella vectensis]